MTGSSMATYIATSPDREEEARDAMVRELYRLVNEQVSVDELERARNYAAGLVEIGQQSGATVASKILGGCVYGFIDDLWQTPDRLRAVSADDVQRAAASVFGGGRAEFVLRGTSGSRQSATGSG